VADAPAPLVPLLAALSALVGWLREAEIAGVVIGGVAVSLLGRPRATRDVDAVMWLDDEQRLADLVNAASAHDLRPRLEDAVLFARQNRVLLLRHEGSSVDLDVALGGLPFEQEAIDQAIERTVAGVSIPLPRPEDLVIMKAIAQRPRDFADIEGLVAATPTLDNAYILRWVRDFAEALEAPELLYEVERRLRPGRKGSDP
jgi:hypothetical protein